MTDFEAGRLISSAVHATTPGAYRKRRRTSFIDTPKEEVDRCLNCPFGECRDCVGTTKKDQTMADKLKEVMLFLNMNVSVTEACQAVGISRRTYYKYQKQNGGLAYA